MSRSRMAGLSLLFTLVLAVAPACSPSAAQPASPAAAKSSAKADQGTARVAVVHPERGSIRRTTEQPGQLVAFETAPMHAKLAGYVESVAVNIGDRVQKGQELARLDMPELVADVAEKAALLEQARAEVVQDRAAIAMAQAGVHTAQAKRSEVKASTQRVEADVARWASELKRVEQLVRESAVTSSLLDETRSKQQSALASRAELESLLLSADAAQLQSEAALEKARADAVASEAHVRVAEAELRRVEAMAAYTHIRAPFAGVVTRRNVDPGHLTRPGSEAEPLFVVARVDKVTIPVYVPESEATRVEPGDRVSVRVVAEGNRTVQGQVARTSWALDAPTRTLRAEIDLDNPDGTLRPGLYVAALIVVDERRDVSTLPLSAVVKLSGKSHVFTVKDAVAHAVPIELGLDDGQRVEVKSGLAGSDWVVVNPANLRDGQSVERIEPPAAPAAQGKP